MAEYISREEVMSVIANMKVEHHYDAANLEDRYVVAHLLEVADKIKDLKAADVQPVKHGRWIWNSSPEFGNPYGSYICSECESKQAYRENFCPNCGARMDGDTE